MAISVIGILSFIFGVIGFLLSHWYIGFIPCFIAVILGVIGISDYLSRNWASIAGIIFSVLGFIVFGYTLVSDINSSKLIIYYNTGNKIYLSNYKQIEKSLNELENTINEYIDEISDMQSYDAE